jgi:hypothetical protein
MTTSEDTTELTDNRPSSPVAPACCIACGCTEIDHDNPFQDTVYFDCGSECSLASDGWTQWDKHGCVRAFAAAVELRARVRELETEHELGQWMTLNEFVTIEELTEERDTLKRLYDGDTKSMDELRARLEQAEARLSAAFEVAASWTVGIYPEREDIDHATATHMINNSIENLINAMSEAANNPTPNTERNALAARVGELQAQLQKRDGELFDCQSKSEAGYDILKECAEVLAYCKPSFYTVYGFSPEAMQEKTEQAEKEHRYKKLCAALASGAAVEGEVK